MPNPTPPKIVSPTAPPPAAVNPATAAFAASLAVPAARPRSTGMPQCPLCHGRMEKVRGKGSEIVQLQAIIVVIAGPIIGLLAFIAFAPEPAVYMANPSGYGPARDGTFLVCAAIGGVITLAGLITGFLATVFSGRRLCCHDCTHTAPCR